MAGQRVLSRIDLVRVYDQVLGRAGVLPIELQSLDAIHLATTGRIGRDLVEIVTYDQRMAPAARQMGYKVSSPA